MLGTHDSTSLTISFGETEMKRTIFQILGACYVAFALVMASSGTITAVDRTGDIQETTNQVVEEDRRSNGDSKRLLGYQGRGSGQSSAAIASPTSETTWTQEGEYGWVDLSDSKIEKQLAAFTSNCAIFWTADWCQSCKGMYPLIDKLVKEGYTVHIVNYDENKALSIHMEIKKLPTTIIWNGRKEVARHVGTVSPERIKKTLKKNEIPDYDIW